MAALTNTQVFPLSTVVQFKAKAGDVRIGQILLVASQGEVGISLGANEGDETQALLIPEGGHLYVGLNKTFTAHGTGSLTVVSANMIEVV